jgi:hypothetical protein
MPALGMRKAVVLACFLPIRTHSATIQLITQQEVIYIKKTANQSTCHYIKSGKVSLFIFNRYCLKTSTDSKQCPTVP